MEKNILKIHKEYIDNLKKELSRFQTGEQLLRAGGISTETLDRLAHGFSEEDIKILNPNQLKIKWEGDLDNVKYQIEKSGLTPKQWASKVNLSEPIDVSYWGDDEHNLGFYIEDGHHRFMAAKLLDKPLNVNLEINVNPIQTMAHDMGYDEFHRYIFNLYKTNNLYENSKPTIKVIRKTLAKCLKEGRCLKEDAEEVPDILYHGTDKKFTTFNDNKPIFFVDNLDVAKTYGPYIVKAKLYMDNPIELDFEGGSTYHFFDKWYLPSDLANKLKSIATDMKNRYSIDEDLKEYLECLGFSDLYGDLDGVIMKNINDSMGDIFAVHPRVANNYVVFDKKQIKISPSNEHHNIRNKKP